MDTLAKYAANDSWLTALDTRTKSGEFNSDCSLYKWSMSLGDKTISEALTIASEDLRENPHWIRWFRMHNDLPHDINLKLVTALAEYSPNQATKLYLRCKQLSAEEKAILLPVIEKHYPDVYSQITGQAGDAR